MLTEIIVGKNCLDNCDPCSGPSLSQAWVTYCDPWMKREFADEGQVLKPGKVYRFLGSSFYRCHWGVIMKGKRDETGTCDSGSHPLGKTWGKEIKQKIPSGLLSPHGSSCWHILLKIGVKM